MTETNDNKPSATKQFDRVHAAIWRHEGEGDQSGATFFQVTISRNYKDRNDKWQQSHSFTPRDLPHVLLAVDWALKELLLKSELSIVTPQDPMNRDESDQGETPGFHGSPVGGDSTVPLPSESQSLKKNRLPALPALRNALKINTYDAFRHVISQFVAGLLKFLLIVGSPGTSKSQSVKRAVGNRPHLFLETHATAFGMYHALFKHRDLPVITDDLDHIYGDPASVRILKCLCNTDPVKRLCWPSRHADIVSGEIPASFTTCSPVCLIANEWQTKNANVQAIEDRAIVVHFVPSAEEIHARVLDWFDDAEVYDFIGEYLTFIPRHSMRHYEKGSQLRQALPDAWKGWLLQNMGVDERVTSIVQLMTSPDFSDDAERIAAFETAGHGSRATFYRWKKSLGMT